MKKTTTVFSEELKKILETATDTTMTVLENSHPFKDELSFTLYLIAHVITSPADLAKAFNISKPAAIWICSRLDEIVIPNEGITAMQP